MSRGTGPVALVTGVTGFIGSHLVRRLVAEDWAVHVLVRPASQIRRGALEAEGMTVVTGDVADAVSVDDAVRRAAPEVIFHLANRTDLRLHNGDLAVLDPSVDVNLTGTLNVVRAAESAGVSRVVRAGGLEEYGSGPSPSREDQREQPVSPYSASQVAATHYCQMLQPHLSCAVVTLRPALVYGPGQSTDFLIPSLIRACLDGRNFVLAAGHHGRDLVYVDDLVEALIRAATAPGLAGIVINVGSGREYLIRDVAELIVRLTGASIRLVPGASRPRFTDLEHLAARIDRAAELLGWGPETPLEVGLRRTIAWYRDVGGLAAPAPAEGT